MTTIPHNVVAEAVKNLHIPRHRAPYGPQARMEDVIRKNATPVQGRHAAVPSHTPKAD
jgi:hypothetical protein